MIQNTTPVAPTAQETLAMSNRHAIIRTAQAAVILLVGSLITGCSGGSSSGGPPPIPAPIQTIAPTTTPTHAPTTAPTSSPTAPGSTPTTKPSSTPSPSPTTAPTSAPTAPGSTPTAKPSSTPSPSPTPAPTASPTPTPAIANASGTVVDFATGVGLPGVSVAVAPYTHGAAPILTVTTNASGVFSFSIAPGTYLLTIGSNSPTDTRTTFHNQIVLTAGTNALSQGVPNPELDVVLSPGQTSGNFRLAQLTSIEQSCLSAANTGRATAGLSTLIPDEQATEYTRAVSDQEAVQMTDTPTLTTTPPYYYYGITAGIAAFGGAGFTSCPEYTNAYTFGTGSTPYSAATNPSDVWYAANWNTETYTGQIFLTDPRP